MSNSTRAKSRTAKLVASPFETAVQAIGKLEPGCRVIGLTKGQFSLLDLLQAVLAQTGPADVIVSTWTTGIRDAENARMLLQRGTIRSFRLLTDRSFATRQPTYCKAITDVFGRDAIACTNTHAKFALIQNDRWNIAIRSSMNLNRNPRFEQFDLDDDAAICSFFRTHVDELAASTAPGLQPTFADISSSFKAALGGGVSDVYAVESPTDDDAPIDMGKLLAVFA
jgi:hypothetical protein